VLLKTRRYIHKYDHAIFSLRVLFLYGTIGRFPLYARYKISTYLISLQMGRALFRSARNTRGYGTMDKRAALIAGQFDELRNQVLTSKRGACASTVNMCRHVPCTMYIEQIFISTAKYVSKINSPRPSPPPSPSGIRRRGYAIAGLQSPTTRLRVCY